MAAIEYTQKEIEGRSASVERIEVRPWGLGGKKHQLFSIGSGANFDASGNIWVEIIYMVSGIQFFYTRNFIHDMGNGDSVSNLGKRLEQFRLGEVDAYGFGDMLPETSIILKRNKYTHKDENNQEVTSSSYHLEISADVGAVIGHESPGMRMINIQLPYISMEEGVKFMQDLTDEIIDAYHGRHPNPAELPAGSSDWHFMRQLNQRAYNQISEDYQEEYFSNPHLTEMFDTWLGELPFGGHILDAGCGHGQPVIARLLEKGYRVTGTDLSPRMLERARGNFPGVSFINQMIGEIRSEAEYDGACSLSSMLYLDPIDLSHAVYRLYRALKPGGLLFLYANDLHPAWRGLPYGVDIKQWMWSWSHGMDEAAQALEEFGYFKVLNKQDVTTETQREERLASWRKEKQESHDKLVQSMPVAAMNIPPFELPKVPENLAYAYAIIARRAMD